MISPTSIQERATGTCMLQHEDWQCRLTLLNPEVAHTCPQSMWTQHCRDAKESSTDSMETVNKDSLPETPNTPGSSLSYQLTPGTRQIMHKASGPCPLHNIIYRGHTCPPVCATYQLAAQLRQPLKPLDWSLSDTGSRNIIIAGDRPGCPSGCMCTRLSLRLQISRPQLGYRQHLFRSTRMASVWHQAGDFFFLDEFALRCCG